MRYVLIFIFVALLASCNSEDNLSKFCGNVGNNQCYAVWTDHYKDPQLDSYRNSLYFMEKSKKGLVGKCKFGVPTCDEDANIIDCQGAVYPDYFDPCDGIDNNCNGKIDEDISSLPSRLWRDADGDNPCGTDKGVCAWAMISCNDGEYVCEFPGIHEPDGEISCDGYDNDCNGKLDDLPPKGFCFGDSWWKATSGECRAGLEICERGLWKCDGEILPATEQCDGKDNNCNGIVDDTEEALSAKNDIVFIIDTSASMCDIISVVLEALDEYVHQFGGATNYRFAIVDMSGKPSEGPLVSVISQFSDLATTQSKLENVGCDGYAEEASMDSLGMVCNNDNPLDLNWRDDSNRLLFMFTDEESQSYTPEYYFPVDVYSECLLSNTLPFIWSYGDADFNTIASNSGGEAFILDSDWTVLFDQMNGILVGNCVD